MAGFGLSVLLLTGCAGGAAAAPPAATAPPTATALPCFPGAFYRKILSTRDAWTGLAGVVTLPTPATDPARYDDARQQALDNFSIYMGGTGEGGAEVDAGLTWEITRDPDGAINRQRRLFRPFWRTSDPAAYGNAPAEEDLYWHPGERVRMAVEVVAPGRLRLTIADASGGGKHFRQEFAAPGFSPQGQQQLKRVNAIDQVGNEGKPVQPTAAHVDGAVWSSLQLTRPDGTQVALTPAVVAAAMQCPAPRYFRLTETHRYDQETITIAGSPP